MESPPRKKASIWELSAPPNPHASAIDLCHPLDLAFPDGLQGPSIPTLKYPLPSMFTASVETLTEEKVEQRTAHEPLFQIILFDDDEHSYPYVIEMLGNIFGLLPEEANRIAYEVDYLGQATVKVCPHGEAVAGCKQITSYGADPRIENSRGSMNATVEPAP